MSITKRAKPCYYSIIFNFKHNEVSNLANYILLNDCQNAYQRLWTTAVPLNIKLQGSLYKNELFARTIALFFTVYYIHNDFVMTK